MQQKWNEKYISEVYLYGKEPNSFLKEELAKLKPGRILFLGEGEGRNAVYAASLGWEVDALDFSEEGKRKAELLAVEKQVKINYLIEDFSNLQLQKNMYDAIGIIYIHQDESIRNKIFMQSIDALKHEGRIIFECFEKEQINYSSGGPKDIDLLYSLEDVANELIELEFEKFAKETIELNEGEGHKGTAAVIRFVGQKNSQ